MPRQKSTAIQQRDRIIMAELQAGIPALELCSKYDISRARISQIVKEQSQHLPEDDERAMLAIVMAGMSAELTKDFYHLEAAPFLTVKGEVVVNPATGEIIYDSVTHQKVKNDTAKAVIAIQESLRKMYAYDAPKKQEVSRDDARARSEEWLAELDQKHADLERAIQEAKAQGIMIEGEVIGSEVDHNEPPEQHDL